MAEKQLYRRQIAFDLDYNKLQKHFPPETPHPIAPELLAYEEIKKFFISHDFIHSQQSVYISKKEMSDSDISSLIMKLIDEIQWFSECVKKLALTNLGDIYDLMPMVEHFSFIPEFVEFNKETDEINKQMSLEDILEHIAQRTSVDKKDSDQQHFKNNNHIEMEL